MKKPIVFVTLLIFLMLGLNLLFPEIFLYDNLQFIRAYHHKWMTLYSSNPLKVISLFLIFNIVMAMLPVPGISMISFLGGSIFGFIPGALYSSMATALGNLGGFLHARYFFRNWVMEKYGKKVKIFEEDWEVRGAMALFSFRLFPLIPSFVANLIMGVSPLKWWTFFWVSWVGRIPMVLVYTYAGVQVAAFDHLADALSPSVIGVFIVLAIFPWAFKYYFRQREKR